MVVLIRRLVSNRREIPPVWRSSSISCRSSRALFLGLPSCGAGGFGRGTSRSRASGICGSSSLRMYVVMRATSWCRWRSGSPRPSSGSSPVAPCPRARVRPARRRSWWDPELRPYPRQPVQGREYARNSRTVRRIHGSPAVRYVEVYASSFSTSRRASPPRALTAQMPKDAYSHVHRQRRPSASSRSARAVSAIR